eukprot:214129-Rhodomonas_salina.1
MHAAGGGVLDRLRSSPHPLGPVPSLSAASSGPHSTAPSLAAGQSLQWLLGSGASVSAAGYPGPDYRDIFRSPSSSAGGQAQPGLH